MKKYKLIKKYPSLPSTMEIGFEVEWDIYLRRYHHALTLDLFYEDWVENFPEFWEKVIIKEFKILFQIKDGYLFDEVIEGNGISECLGSAVGKDKIIKVKRLSDGEKFTLLDKITPEPFVRGRKFTVVDKIYFNEHNQLSYSTNKGTSPCTFVFGQDTSHYKSPILITEDRVELFEGDYYYRVLPNFTVTRATIKGRFINAYPGAKLFSTEEAALKHVIYHKKMLSVKDVFEAWKESKSTYPISISFLENIKNLVDKRVKR